MGVAFVAAGISLSACDQRRTLGQWPSEGSDAGPTPADAAQAEDAGTADAGPRGESDAGGTVGAGELGDPTQVDLPPDTLEFVAEGDDGTTSMRLPAPVFCNIPRDSGILTVHATDDTVSVDLTLSDYAGTGVYTGSAFGDLSVSAELDGGTWDNRNEPCEMAVSAEDRTGTFLCPSMFGFGRPSITLSGAFHCGG
jgi:hypothetical protein